MTKLNTIVWSDHRESADYNGTNRCSICRRPVLILHEGCKCTECYDESAQSLITRLARKAVRLLCEAGFSVKEICIDAHIRESTFLSLFASRLTYSHHINAMDSAAMKIIAVAKKQGIEP